MGIGIPLWYMLCSSDKGSNHEQVALETCLRVIFARRPTVRPNAIVIDKCWTSYNATTNVVATVHQYWIVVNGQRSQTHCRLLLCQFHAKKSWVDNLLPKVNATEEDGKSISRNQQISAKGSATIDILQELIGNSPNTSKSHNGKLQRGASQARRRLPICDQGVDFFMHGLYPIIFPFKSLHIMKTFWLTFISE